MHTEMWEHPAVQENLATLRRRGVHVLEPATGRLAGGDVGAGRLPSRRSIVEAAARFLSSSRGRRRGPRSRSPDGACSSPPAAPASRSIPFATSRTAPRASRAMPSPRPPPSSARDVTLVTTTTLPDRTRHRGRRSRDGRGDGRRRARARRRSPTSSSWPPPSLTSARQSWPPRSSTRTTGRPRSSLVPTSTSSPSSAAAGAPGRCSSASRPRPTTLAERASAKLEAKGVDLVVANDVGAPGVGFGHDTNAVTIFGRDGLASSRSRSSRRRRRAAVLDAALPLLADHWRLRRCV